MDWKALLTAIAGALVIILQIINVILSNDIEGVLGQKTKLMEQKAADLQSLVQKTIDLDTQVEARTAAAAAAHTAIKDQIAQLKPPIGQTVPNPGH